MGWFSALMQRRLIRRGAPLAILVLIVGAIAGGVALGTTTIAPVCSNPDTLEGSRFEIDAPPPPATKTGANMVVNATNCIDWLTGGNVNDGFRSAVTVKADTTSGSGDESFGEGTKEDTAEPTIVDGGIPPNKSDLKAFGIYTEAGQATTGNPTGKFLELFWTRVQDPSGTTNMDFELNKRSCTPPDQLPPNTTDPDCAPNGYTPLRTAGVDKLITYDLSRGGTRATISIRTWNGSAWGSPTVLTSQNPPQALGTINTSLITNSPLGPLDPRTFGEASIAFSALFGTSTCGEFGSAYLKSRSSDSFTAALKDFVPPQQVSISNCSGISTNASSPASNPATIGDSISDTATLSGVTPDAGGTITFKLYGPDATPNELTESDCTGTPVFTPLPVNVVNGSATSPAYTPTAVGTYRWIASYSGDANNAPVSGACTDANETSVVSPREPQISTNASSPASNPATIGDSISDTATLTGATSDADGTITFRLYGPDNADCSGEAIFTSVKNVSEDANTDGTYTSASFTPTAVGTYRWIASYSGDAKNDPVSGACNDANEASVVSPREPQISTNASSPASNPATIGDSISDTATLTGATNDANGTITFRLYGPDNADCSGDAIFTSVKNVNEDANTDGTYTSGSYTPTAVGTYRWIASYSGDAKNDPVSGACNDANEASVVNKAPANIATAQELFPQDSATLTSSLATPPAGDVHFALYATSDCSGTPAYEETVTLDNGTANTNNTSFSVDESNDGNYKWLVTYTSNDNKHENATSACGKEAFSATIDNDTTP